MAFSSEASKSAYKTPNITNITDKLRAENKLFSQDNRLKVRLIYESLKLITRIKTYKRKGCCVHNFKLNFS